MQESALIVELLLYLQLCRVHMKYTALAACDPNRGCGISE